MRIIFLFPTLPLYKGSKLVIKPVPSLGDIDEGGSLCTGGSGIFGRIPDNSKRISLSSIALGKCGRGIRVHRALRLHARDGEPHDDSPAFQRWAIVTASPCESFYPALKRWAILKLAPFASEAHPTPDGRH